VELLIEITQVLSRPKFATILAKAGTDASSLARCYSSLAQVVAAPLIPAPPDLLDPDDVIVLACAQSARAEIIVSADKDLLTMKSFAGIPILTVRQTLEHLGLRACLKTGEWRDAGPRIPGRQEPAALQ